MTTRHLKNLAAATLLLLAANAAQADNNTGMPDGSHDVSFAVTAFDAPRSEGGKRRQVGVLPSFTGRWSNGLFAALGQVGMDLSEDPVLNWGPLLTYDLRQRRTDDPSDKGGLDLEGGGFVHYLWANNVHFNSAVLYGGGANRTGIKLVGDVDLGVRLGPHAGLTLSPGFEVANASYMKSTFGVTPAQSAYDHLGPYATHAGLKNVFLDAAFDWQLSNKWTMRTGVNTSRLVGSAGDSPLTQQRTTATEYLQFSYHY
jgi:outer membrane scaffolding protein for murein synthesis (MipA/OmpV family)